MSRLQAVDAPGKLQASPGIDHDLEDPSCYSINEQDHFYPQDPDFGEATREVQQDLTHKGPTNSPTSPPLNHHPGEFPHLPQPEPDPADEEGNSSNDENGGVAGGEDEDVEDDEGIDLPSVSTDDPWPQPVLPKLSLAKEMIESIKSVRLEDDLDEEILANIKCPPEEPEMLDNITLFSMFIFNNLISCSEKVYEGVRATIQRFTGHEIDTHHVVKSKIERTTRVTQLQTDMCIKSCLAFAGPLKEMDKCPTCNENRYEENRKTKKLQPRKQFYTIPVGPQIQAMWRTPEGADRMRYRDRKTAEIIQTIHATGKIPKFEDVLHGSEYLDACRAGKITPDDTLLMFSLDGAQLYRDKESSQSRPALPKNIRPSCLFCPGPQQTRQYGIILITFFQTYLGTTKARTHGLRWSSKASNKLSPLLWFWNG